MAATLQSTTGDRPFRPRLLAIVVRLPCVPFIARQVWCQPPRVPLLRLFQFHDPDIFWWDTNSQ